MITPSSRTLGKNVNSTPRTWSQVARGRGGGQRDTQPARGQTPHRKSTAGHVPGIAAAHGELTKYNKERPRGVNLRGKSMRKHRCIVPREIGDRGKLGASNPCYYKVHLLDRSHDGESYTADWTIREKIHRAAHNHVNTQKGYFGHIEANATLPDKCPKGWRSWGSGGQGPGPVGKLRSIHTQCHGVVYGIRIIGSGSPRRPAFFSLVLPVHHTLSQQHRRHE